MINKKTYSLKIKHNQGAVPVNSEGSDRRLTLTQLLVTSFCSLTLGVERVRDYKSNGRTNC